MYDYFAGNRYLFCLVFWIIFLWSILEIWHWLKDGNAQTRIAKPMWRMQTKERCTNTHTYHKGSQLFAYCQIVSLFKLLTQQKWNEHFIL